MSLSRWLPEEAIRLKVEATDWREAITKAGEALVDTGVTDEQYTAEMIEAVEELGPYIVLAPGLALAHSRPSPAVKRAGLSWVTLKTAIEFGSKDNDPVDLVIGLAAQDSDGHIEMMTALATVISDPDVLSKLRAAQQAEEVTAVLDGLT